MSCVAVGHTRRSAGPKHPGGSRGIRDAGECVQGLRLRVVGARQLDLPIRRCSGYIPQDDEVRFDR